MEYVFFFFWIFVMAVALVKMYTAHQVLQKQLKTLRIDSITKKD